MARQTRNSLQTATDIGLSLASPVALSHEPQTNTSNAVSGLLPYVFAPKKEGRHPEKEPLKKAPHARARHKAVPRVGRPLTRKPTVLKYSSPSHLASMRDSISRVRTQILPCPSFPPSCYSKFPTLLSLPNISWSESSTEPDSNVLIAASILMQIYHSETVATAKHNANEVQRSRSKQEQKPSDKFPTSDVRCSGYFSDQYNDQIDDCSGNVRIGEWDFGDARRDIVASGLSPQARRMRDVAVSPNQLKDEKGQVGTDFSKAMNSETDRRYFDHLTLTDLRVSPPNQSNAKIRYMSPDESDMTALSGSSSYSEYELDAGAYNAASSLRRGGCPIRKRSKSKALQSESDPTSAYRTPISSTKMAHETSRYSSSRPVRPLTSPISRLPSVEALSPTNSLDRWLQEARRSQHHRRTSSLASFLKRAERQYNQMLEEGGYGSNKTEQAVKSSQNDIERQSVLADKHISAEMSASITTTSSAKQALHTHMEKHEEARTSRGSLEEGEIIEDEPMLAYQVRDTMVAEDRHSRYWEKRFRGRVLEY